MQFTYEKSIDLKEVDVLDAPALRRGILDRVADGWRLLALFGLPERVFSATASARDAGLCALLWHTMKR